MSWKLNRALAVGYVRDKATQDEIDGLAALPPVSLKRRLSSKSQIQSLRIETLVALTRYLITLNQEMLARDLLADILRRASSNLRWVLGRRGLTGPAAVQAIEEIVAAAVYEICDLSEKQSFWECRFWVCLRRLAWTAVNSIIDRSADVALEDDFGDDTDEWRELATPNDPLADVVDRIVATDALQLLPLPIQKAFYLRTCQGYAIESADATEPTVSKMLGVSARTVRNYLARAEKQLAQWRLNHK